MSAMLTDVLWGFNYLVLAYFFLINTVYLVTSLIAFRFLRTYAERLKATDIEELLASGAFPPVTLVAPAYNEEAIVVDAVRSFLTLRYADYEIVVVNDGSTDRTRERLIDAYEMVATARQPSASLPSAVVRQVYRSRRHPHLWLVDKEPGGSKADAANAGINVARTPLVCVIDCDGVLERDALVRIARPFVEDDRTLAVGGIVRVANGCRVEDGMIRQIRLPTNLWARIQVLEYLRAFLSGRVGWSMLNATMIISGAFGAFRRDVLVAAGGYRPDAVGEDMELVVRLHRHCRLHGIPYRTVFIPDPVAWTEAPEQLAALGHQRDRWQRGLADTMKRHMHMLFNPRYGTVGMLAFPYYFFLEGLGALLEGLGYLVFALTLVLGLATAPYLLAFVGLAVVFGIALSTAAVVLEEMTFRRYERFRDLLHLLWLAVAENIGYRQLVTWWRVRGMIAFARGSKRWEKIPRRGFTDAVAP